MGKLRFKLSHVMPHVWFYKLKEIGKADEHSSHGKSSQPAAAVRTAKSRSLGRIYTSPVNHKAIDISFPETPCKRSPLNQSLKGDDESGMANSASATSIVSQQKKASLLSFSLDQDAAAFEVDDDAADTPAASEGKLAVWGNGVCFDVRELERRLKALGSEERRKYYNSPMFSVALPSPILDAAASQVDALPESLDLLHSSVFGEERCSCSAKAVYEESKSFEGARSSNASTSFRLSTSSEDTGLDRASSSLWERDVFSLTSEGSDLFTTIDEIDSSLLQRSIRQHRKPKEKKRYSSKSSKAAHESGPFFHASHDLLNRTTPDNGKSTIRSYETQPKTASSSDILEMQQGIRRTDSVKYLQLQAEQPLQELLEHEAACNLSMLEYECDDRRSCMPPAIWWSCCNAISH